MGEVVSIFRSVPSGDCQNPPIRSREESQFDGSRCRILPYSLIFLQKRTVFFSLLYLLAEPSKRYEKIPMHSTMAISTRYFGNRKNFSVRCGFSRSPDTRRASVAFEHAASAQGPISTILQLTNRNERIARLVRKGNRRVNNPFKYGGIVCGPPFRGPLRRNSGAGPGDGKYQPRLFPSLPAGLEKNCLLHNLAETLEKKRSSPSLNARDRKRYDPRNTPSNIAMSNRKEIARTRSFCFSRITDAMVGAETPCMIRVAPGTFHENVTIPKGITVEIGWDATFTTMDHNYPVVFRRPVQ